MDAIILRPRPGHATVRALGQLLIAAPMAISMTLVSLMVVRHWQAPVDAPSNIRSSRADAKLHAFPDITSRPALQVAPFTFAAGDVKDTLRVDEAIAQARRPRRVGNISVEPEGLTAPDGSHFELEGVVMPEQDARCRRIDGVTVSCWERVLARIAILSGLHPIECQLMPRGSRVMGRCHAGKMDLAEDLVRNGLVRRTTWEQTARR